MAGAQEHDFEWCYKPSEKDIYTHRYILINMHLYLSMLCETKLF